MARVFRLPNGNYVAQLPDGQVLPVPEQLRGEMYAEHVLQEPAFQTGERLLLKNFTTGGNVAGARQLAESWGYETRPLNTRGVNFAARKRGDANATWKVLDPDTGIFSKDFLADMGDLAFDAVQTAVVGAATSGGPLAAGAAAGLTELVREAVGELTGIKGNISPSEIGLQAAIPGVLKVGGVATRGLGRGVGAVGRLASEAAGRVAGVSPFAGATIGQTLIQRAQLPERALPAVLQVAKKLKALTRAAQSGRVVGGKVIMRGGMFPEKQLALQQLTAADAQGATVNLSPVIDHLRSVLAIGQEAAKKRGKESALHGRTVGVLDRIFKQVADSDGIAVDAVDFSRIRPTVAAEIKETLQAITTQAEKNAFTAPTTKVFAEHVGFGAGVARREVEAAMERVGFKKYSQLMGVVDSKTRHMKALARAIDAYNLTDHKKAATYVRRFFAEGNAANDALREFEKAFGFNAQQLLEPVRQAGLGEAFAGKLSRGIASTFPRLAATGEPVGINLLAAGSLPVVGGLLYGIPGAVAGAVAAAPRTVLGATRLALRAANASVPASIRGSARVASVYALQESARQLGGKSVAREDQRKKKPTVLTGY